VGASAGVMAARLVAGPEALAAPVRPSQVAFLVSSVPTACNACHLTVLRRARVGIAAQRRQDHLPPAFVARLYGYAPELMAPPRPTGGMTAAQDRVRRRAVAERAARAAANAAARRAKPRAPVGARPPRGAGLPGPDAPIPGQRVGSAGMAEVQAGWRCRRLRPGAECEFRAGTLWNRERVGSDGLAGVWAGWCGRRLQPGAKCDFRARTLCKSRHTSALSRS